VGIFQGLRECKETRTREREGIKGKEVGAFFLSFPWLKRAVAYGGEAQMVRFELSSINKKRESYPRPDSNFRFEGSRWPHRQKCNGSQIFLVLF